METQFAWPEARPALKASDCCVDGCRSSVSAELETQPFCLDHFVSASLRELESRSVCLKEKKIDASALDSLKGFLAECCEQTQALSQGRPIIDPSAQSRLKDILRRATQLAKNLRRSPRLEASVPVWLRREDPRHTWEEETWTSTVSRHGAGFVCRHSVEINGIVVLCRRDKGNRAHARVVYSRLDAEGRRHVGVELLDRDDFWDPPKVPAPGVIRSIPR